MIISLIFLITIYILSSTNAFSSNNECLWSTYRPGPYFGLRSTVKDSPLFGLMWYYPENIDSANTMRHFMEIRDYINKYEWKAHNGCDFGRLVIVDTQMNIILNVEFANEYNPGTHENKWVVKIQGQPINEQLANKGVVIMWYISNSNKNAKNSNFGIEFNHDKVFGTYLKNNAKVSQFAMLTVQDATNKHPVYGDISYDKEYYLVMNISEDRLYDPTEFIKGELKDTVGIVPNHLVDSNDSYRSSPVKKGNVFVQQIFYLGSFRMDIHYFEGDVIDSNLDVKYVDYLINQKSQEFEQKFDSTFKLDSDYYNFFKINDSNDVKLTALSALSTLLSNILYMNGKMFILDKNDNSIILSEETELLTIGPDKTSHGRGFMWDEGFQQRVLSLWNLEMSLKIIKNWFDNVDSTGWLAREQALDNESRARAPFTSWSSIPDNSNPPSLFLFIDHLFDRKIDANVFKSFLSSIIIKMELNANWYLNTQKSSIPCVYSWKGKTDEFCLPSGLDDYPRAKLGNEVFPEGHLDLQSWIIALSRTMIKIYKFINEKDNFITKIEDWTKTYECSMNSLIKYYWNEDKQIFDDFYMKINSEKIFAGHLGYLQLFPLVLNVFDTSFLEISQDYSIYINPCLDLIIDPTKGLRTKYGIRSLSINDLYYKQGQNYWTSPIWININYLILNTFNKIKYEPQYKRIIEDYENLKSSVVNNMVLNFSKNGYIWEVYDDEDGHGKYNHPFTGWSALILNLIYELY